MTKKVLITGTSGFIGFHLSKILLQQGFRVFGIDGMTDYYDVRLKMKRQQSLLQTNGFYCINEMLENIDNYEQQVLEFNPEIIIHLAAQAGVQYSLENPRAYLDSNIVGTFNIMELARKLEVKHLLLASTSSVYGANEEMPFDELQKTETPLTFYAATKKANEAMSHSYAHVWNLPTTMFRFFTVYGPWGRPDMALFKFTKGIIDGTPIDIYNHGEMYRDFTYVEDLVRAIALLVDQAPPKPSPENEVIPGDSISPVAPWRVVNIGNSTMVRLMDFIEAIEKELGTNAIYNFMDMQVGDVPATWANSDLLKRLTGFRPNTEVAEGIHHFVSWYTDYYNIQIRKSDLKK